MVPIFSLTEIDGNAWSVDGRYYVTEWSVEVNHAGVLRNVLNIIPLRLLQMDCSVLHRDGCSPQPVGMWRVGESDMWVGVGSQFIQITMTHTISSDGPSLSQKDSIQNQWSELPADVRGNDLMIMSVIVVDGSMSQSEEVEVWGSTSLGDIFIWSGKNGVVESVIHVERMVSTMLLVQDEVNDYLRCYVISLSFFVFV